MSLILLKDYEQKAENFEREIIKTLLEIEEIERTRTDILSNFKEEINESKVCSLVKKVKKNEINRKKLYLIRCLVIYEDCLNKIEELEKDLDEK